MIEGEFSEEVSFVVVLVVCSGSLLVVDVVSEGVSEFEVVGPSSDNSCSMVESSCFKLLYLLFYIIF